MRILTAPHSHAYIALTACELLDYKANDSKQNYNQDQIKCLVFAAFAGIIQHIIHLVVQVFDFHLPFECSSAHLSPMHPALQTLHRSCWHILLTGLHHLRFGPKTGPSPLFCSTRSNFANRLTHLDISSASVPSLVASAIGRKAVFLSSNDEEPNRASKAGTATLFISTPLFTLKCWS